MLRWSAGRRARRAAPDAIHVIGVPMTRAGTRAARRAHVPLIVDRGADTAAVPRTRFGVRRERRLLQGASAIVTGSESDAQKLRDRQGQRVNPLVCRNIPEPLRVSPTPAKLRRRLRLPSGGLVLMSGDEPPQQEAVGLAQALAKSPDIHLVVLGADSWKSTETIALEAERLCCGGRLHLLRAVPPRRVGAYAAKSTLLCALRLSPLNLLSRSIASSTRDSRWSPAPAVELRRSSPGSQQAGWRIPRTLTSCPMFFVWPSKRLGHLMMRSGQAPAGGWRAGSSSVCTSASPRRTALKRSTPGTAAGCATRPVHWPAWRAEPVVRACGVRSLPLMGCGGGGFASGASTPNR